MKNKIINALRVLDPLNEQHWTGQGLARVDVVGEMVGDFTITRRDIAAAAPDFNRDTAQGYDWPAVTVSIGASLDDMKPVDGVIELTVNLSSAAALESEKAILQTQLEDVQRQRYELQSREIELTQAIDRLSGEIDKLAPPPRLFDHIQSYQQRQRELAAQRAREAENLARAGIRVPKVMSPIDEAMARSKRRGRPEYPSA